jgi:ABC-type antimicrobial peptide transport system permease subunit
VLSYTVAQRSRELAVRTALGARRIDIMRLVVRQGIMIVVAGAAIGLPCAMLLSGAARAMLYGVSTRDPFTYAWVPLLLIAIAVLACAVPAWRASRLDPLRVLKAD